MFEKKDLEREKNEYLWTGNDYINRVLGLFVEVRKCRMGHRDDPLQVIAELKRLDRAGRQPYAPLLQYIIFNLRMTLAVLGDIRYVLAVDKSLFDEIKDYISLLANHVFKHGNVICYSFLLNDCNFVMSSIDELSLATLNNNYELVNYFVTQKSYDVNAVQDGGEPPLITAVDQNYMSLVSLLLENGADILARRDYKSVFTIAIQKGNLLALTKLVEFQNRSGKDISSILDADGFTLLHEAIDYKQQQIVDYLLSFFGKDLKAQNGVDLVTYACIENNYAMADYLVSTYPEDFSFATLCAGDNTILHCCSRIIDTYSSAKSLIDSKKIDITKQNANGDTFLHVAVREKNIIIIKYYLYLYREKKIKSIVNLENSAGKTVCHLLLEEAEKGILIEFIDDTDISLFQKNKFDKTLLESIVASGQKELTFTVLLHIQNTNKAKRKQARGILFKPEILKQTIDFLMHVGVMESHKVPEDEQRITEWVYGEQTPLHIICDKLPFAEIQAMIAQYNFDVNRKNSKKCTVLHHMLINARVIEAKQFIAAYQPSLFELDNMNSSLLHLACELQDLELVEYCLAEGLSPLLNRQNGVNALDIAIDIKNKLVTELLWAKLSVAEQFNYFNEASEQVRQFLQVSKIYLISIEDLLGQLRELALDLFIPVITQQIAQEIYSDLQLHANYLKFQADKICEQALELLGDELSSSLIVSTTQDIAQEEVELEVRADLELKLKEMISEVDVRIQIEQLALKKLDLKEKYTAENMLQAVVERNYNYFRDLPKDDSDILHIVSQCAVTLLLQAIVMGDQQLGIFLLSFPIFEAQAHTQGNIVYIRARDYGQNLLANRLSNIVAVQKERIPKTGIIHQSQGLVPMCSYNPNYRLVLSELARLLNLEKYKDLELYACGSGTIKYSPQDLDLLSPGSENTFTRHLVFDLLEDLVSLGAKASRDAGDNHFGYLSPKVNPSRRIIQVEWWNCKLEIILTTQSLAQHAYSSYSKITALYFCLRHSEMLEIDGLGSLADLHAFIVDTVVEPMLSFTMDFNRIFKLIVLSVTAPANFHLINGNIPSVNYDLSNRVIKTIVDLFSTSNNPFLSYNVMLTKLRPRLAAIFAYDDPLPIIRALYDLNILPHLLEYLHAQKGEHAMAYRASLINIYETMDKQTVTVLQQQIMQIYNTSQVMAEGRYDPRVFQAVPQEMSVIPRQTMLPYFQPGGHNY